MDSAFILKANVFDSSPRKKWSASASYKQFLLLFPQGLWRRIWLWGDNKHFPVPQVPRNRGSVDAVGFSGPAKEMPVCISLSATIMHMAAAGRKTLYWWFMKKIQRSDHGDKKEKSMVSMKTVAAELKVQFGVTGTMRFIKKDVVWFDFPVILL